MKSDTDIHVYIARRNHCGHLIGVSTEDHPKDLAKFLGEFVKHGHPVERITLAAYRAMDHKSVWCNDSCPHAPKRRRAPQVQQLATVLAIACVVALPLGAQSAKDSSVAKVVKTARDSILCTTSASQRQQRACVRLDSLRVGLLTPAPVVPKNVAPVAAFGVSCNLASQCQFTDSSTDRAPGVVAARAWTFGDGATAGNVLTPRHTYAAPGSYTATLTVTDDSAATATVSHVVTIRTSIPPPPPPPDTTPQPPPPPSTAGDPQLPRVVPAFAIPPSSHTTVVGANLQAALTAARGGDELVLPNGAQFLGNFILPARLATDTGWITIRSATVLPDGQRVDSLTALGYATLVTTNTECALRTAVGGTSRWRIRGIRVTIAPTVTAHNYGLLCLGYGDQQQNALATVPEEIVLDQVWVDGADRSISRCIGLNAGATAIVNSQARNCHASGFDSQAIGGWNGPGPYSITNNTLEGAAENVFFGGADPAIPNLIPSDITIRRNWIRTPDWRPTWTTRKNLVETKNAHRVLVEENVIEQSWVGGQMAAFSIKSTNQSGGCRSCQSADITIRRNLIRRAPGGFQIAGHESSTPGVEDSLTRDVLLEENVIDEINIAPWNGTGTTGRLLALTDSVTRLTVRGNVFGAGVIHSFLIVDVRGARQLTYRDNVAPVGTYGIFGSGPAGSPSLSGQAVLTANALGTTTFSGNCIVGASRTGYPVGLTWAASEAGCPSAATTRAAVQAATAGVVKP